MEDRELLELAAKAAGKRIHVWGTPGSENVADMDGPTGNRWNPLTDDGDALRLAVKLNLWLHVEEYGASARRAGGAWLGCEAHLHGGIEAATRRAILAGNKTQTRRVVKEPISGWLNNANGSHKVMDGKVYNYSFDQHLGNCPYGKSGDRLWVRETWSSDFAGHYPHDRVWYAADDDRRHDIEVRKGVRGIYSPESQEFVPFRWRPSIHMPRSACRLVLEV